MAKEALGRVVDVAIGVAPLDMQTSRTGLLVSLKDNGGVLIVIAKGIGTAGDVPTWTLNQYTTSAGGGAATLPIIDHYWVKSATTPGLVGTETWTKVTQTAAATITDPAGSGGTYAQSQMLIALEVDGKLLSSGYSYVALSSASVGSHAQLSTTLYLPRDLDVQRAPEKLIAALS